MYCGTEDTLLLMPTGVIGGAIDDGGSGFLKNASASTHSSSPPLFCLGGDGLFGAVVPDAAAAIFGLSIFLMRSLTDEFLLLRLPRAAVPLLRFSYTGCGRYY